MKKILFPIFVALLLISCGGNTNKSSNSDSNLVLKTVIERCPDCGGDGYARYNCSECNGSGSTYSTCSYCGGSGGHWYRRETQQQIPCSTCGGSGRVRGSGNTICNSCGGSGHRTCALCKGSGMTDILGDWRTCPRCDGWGYEECYLCDGRGYKQGPEYETCRTCWGSGVSGVRPVVEEGYEYCEHCHGNPRTKTYCRNCGGYGYIESYCRTCNGTGKISVEKWVEE